MATAGKDDGDDGDDYDVVAQAVYALAGEGKKVGGDKPGSPYLSCQQLLDRIGANKQIYEPLSVQLNIGGKECRTTIDMGASVSMVRLDTLRKITWSDRPVLRPTRIRVSALTGDAIGILGEVTLMVELDQSRPINFLVVEKAPHPALIGMDVLRALKVSIKIGKGSIKVGGRRYLASAEGVRTAKAGLVRAKENYTLKPWSILRPRASIRKSPSAMSLGGQSAF